MTDQITLTPDQLKASEGLSQFLEKPYDAANWFVSLTGSAGTGKSYLTKHISKDITPSQLALTATTNTAAAILRSIVEGGQDCGTIHRFLGLKVKRLAGKTSLVTRHSFNAADNQSVKYVLLDEASMVDSLIMKKIRQDSLTWNRKYIFVGDPYQLPPIGETHSPAFGVGSSFTLEEVVRQERGSKIIQFATYTRDCIQKDVPVELPDDLLQVVRGKKFTKVVLDHYANQVSSEDTRFLAYTNARVFEANQAIEALRGDPKGGSYIEGQPFREGDIVKVNEAYVLDEEILYPTGEEVRVTAIYPCVKLPLWARGLDAWSVAIESGGAKDSVTVLDNACKSMLRVALERKASQCRRDGKWGEFYDMQEFFIDLRPRHAMTVHKSQGSTFDKVFIDYRNILKNRNVREADRMLYVAVTRAKHEVIIGI